MSTHIERLCGSLELPRADSWAAHATVEQWLREESEPDTETSRDRLSVGSRLLTRLETGDRMTREELSLLADCCRSRLNNGTVPPRDQESLAAVVDHVGHTLAVCSN